MAWCVLWAWARSGWPSRPTPATTCLPPTPSVSAAPAAERLRASARLRLSASSRGRPGAADGAAAAHCWRRPATRTTPRRSQICSRPHAPAVGGIIGFALVYGGGGAVQWAAPGEPRRSLARRAPRLHARSLALLHRRSLEPLITAVAHSAPAAHRRSRPRLLPRHTTDPAAFPPYKGVVPIIMVCMPCAAVLVAAMLWHGHLSITAVFPGLDCTCHACDTERSGRAQAMPGHVHLQAASSQAPHALHLLLLPAASRGSSLPSSPARPPHSRSSSCAPSCCAAPTRTTSPSGCARAGTGAAPPPQLRRAARSVLWRWLGHVQWTSRWKRLAPAALLPLTDPRGPRPPRLLSQSEMCRPPSTRARCCPPR